MPTYVYECEYCGYNFEQRQAFGEDALTYCSACQQHKLARVIQPIILITRHEPQTLAHLAARNTQKMGHYEHEARLEAYYKDMPKKRPQESPWWRPNEPKPDLSLASLTPEQTQAYINTGKKPK